MMVRIRDAAHYSTGLTRREEQVVLLVSLGLTNKQMADRLGLNAETVKLHVSNALRKLSCRRRSELVRYAVRTLDIAP